MPFFYILLERKRPLDKFNIQEEIRLSPHQIINLEEKKLEDRRAMILVIESGCLLQRYPLLRVS